MVAGSIAEVWGARVAGAAGERECLLAVPLAANRSNSRARLRQGAGVSNASTAGFAPRKPRATGRSAATLDVGAAHRDLALSSLGHVIHELADVEDALHTHRTVSTSTLAPAEVLEVRRLNARQRVILHELRRRAHRRARLRPGAPNEAPTRTSGARPQPPLEASR